MKFLLVLLAVSRLAFSLPHGPDADEDDMPAAKPKSSTVAATPAVSTTAATPAASTSAVPVPKKENTPAGCRALNTDIEFPSEQVWKAELPQAVSRKTTLADYVKAPDYKVVAMKYQDVVDAVKFAGKH